MTDDGRNRRAFIRMATVSAGALAIGAGLDGCDGSGVSTAAAQTTTPAVPAIVSSSTALLVMHYQTDVLNIVSSAAPTLLANTRKLCDLARAKGVKVYFAKIQFSPGYSEVSALNKSGQALKSSGLFINDTIAPELGQQASEPLIIGHRISVFFGTDLQERLSAAGIDTLILAGVESTGVVLSTIGYTSDADYRLYTVKDCCYDRDQIAHDHLFSTAFDTRTYVISLADASVLLA
uniref:isochorismatase family cysteine hydrolase n=1 Tax=Paraburkholderia sp. 22B1P TaxID=3080498 RepID=UPI00403F35E5